MELTLVIPAYNEGDIIGDTARAILHSLPHKFDGFELIVVDDGSTDHTSQILRGIPDVTVIRHEKNMGKGRAVRTGLSQSRGDMVFFTDADLAYGLDVIVTGASLLKDTGASIALGSRKLHKGGYGDYPPLRTLASKCFSLVLHTVSGIGYDTQCGIKGFTWHVARDIARHCTCDGYTFDFEAMMLSKRRGYTVAEMPVKIINHRESKVNVARESFMMLREIATIKQRIRKEQLWENTVS